MPYCPDWIPERFRHFEMPGFAEAASIQNAIDEKTKPPGSLGLLERLALQIGVAQRNPRPTFQPAVAVFAADHGISKQDVSAYPRSVTAQMVRNFGAGGAAINALARAHGISLRIVNAGVDADLADLIVQDRNVRYIDRAVARGTRDVTTEDAMSISECVQCLEHGAAVAAELHSEGHTVLGFGEMGIGNSAIASLLHSILLDRRPVDCIGRGTGVDDEGLDRKRVIVERAHTRAKQQLGNAPHPLDVLRTAGGLEIAMIVGATVEAARQGSLVVADGYIACAAVLIAIHAFPSIRDAIVFAHRSGERGHEDMLDAMQARPLLDFDMRLGEGSGAALAMPIIKSAVAFLNEMATFADAGVDDRNRAQV